MDVTNLRVYKQSFVAFRAIEEIATQLPRELEDVKKQILRSSKAVGPILAEGYGRKNSQKEFRRFVIEAMSTSDETVSHLRNIAMSKFNEVPIANLKEVAEVYKSISKQLNSLASKVKQNI